MVGTFIQCHDRHFELKEQRVKQVAVKLVRMAARHQTKMMKQIIRK